MPQLNETLLDVLLLNGVVFIICIDILTILNDVDDNLLIYNNVIIVVFF